MAATLEVILKMFLLVTLHFTFKSSECSMALSFISTGLLPLENAIILFLIHYQTSDTLEFRLDGVKINVEN